MDEGTSSEQELAGVQPFTPGSTSSTTLRTEPSRDIASSPATEPLKLWIDRLEKKTALLRQLVKEKSEVTEDDEEMTDYDEATESDEKTNADDEKITDAENGSMRDKAENQSSQQQGLFVADSPSVPVTRTRATNPGVAAKRSRDTNPEASEESEDTLVQWIKAQLGPMMLGSDLDERMKKLQDDVADIRKNIRDGLTPIKLHVVQTQQRISTEKDQDLARQMQNQSERLGKLEETVGRMEQQFTHALNENERRELVRQEIAAEETKIAEMEAELAQEKATEENKLAEMEEELERKIVTKKAKIANRREWIQKAKTTLAES